MKLMLKIFVAAVAIYATAADAVPYIENFSRTDLPIGIKDPVRKIDMRWNLIELVTAGDMVPLLESFDIVGGRAKASSSEKFLMPGNPDGMGLYQSGDYYFVYVNHEMHTVVKTNYRDGIINGSRISIVVFDLNWNLIGADQLVKTVEQSGTLYTLDRVSGNFVDASGNIMNAERTEGNQNFAAACSAFLAQGGFVDDTGSEIPVFFSVEEWGTDDSSTQSYGVMPNGHAIMVDGGGRFAKENTVAPFTLNTLVSDKTYLIQTEDSEDGEMYMYVGSRTATNPNGLRGEDFQLYVLKLNDVSGTPFAYETMMENVEYKAEWVPVPRAAALGTASDLQTFANVGIEADGAGNGQVLDANGLNSTNFRRLEDIHEDPNRPGDFYFLSTGRNKDPRNRVVDLNGNGILLEEADGFDNGYSKLYRLRLDMVDPIQPATVELLLEGGPSKGVSYDNLVVDSNGMVWLQEDKTAFGGDVMSEQRRHGGVMAYNIDYNENRVGNDVVTMELENSTVAIDPDNAESYGQWESSGIIELQDLGSVSSFLLNVQSHGWAPGNVEGSLHSDDRNNGGQILAMIPTVATAVEEVEAAALPDNFGVSQNYPNPFNPSTQIEFSLPSDGFVSLEVYNMSGQRVKTLANQHMVAGTYKADWDGRDEMGRDVASGSYVYQLRSGDKVEARRMLLLK
jgi:glycerophosphoryl diester phosphodiesterase